MITAGCDIGSLTAKAVLLKDNEIISSAVLTAGVNPSESARRVFNKVMDQAGLQESEISCIVGTGYGKERIPFCTKVESEIACHAKGAFQNLPTVRTVVDIGGQDAKAVKLDQNGKVIRYIYNDKCASGTGRFLEVMAEALEIPLDQMGNLGRQSTHKLKISNQCVIFAETEVVSLINEGRDAADIAAGLHRALANRAAALAKSIGVEPEVVFTGGVAKNIGVATALGASLGVELQVLQDDPQIMGALGAALFAAEI